MDKESSLTLQHSEFKKDPDHQPLERNHAADIPMQSENGIVASSIGKDCVIRKIIRTHIPEKEKFYLKKYNLLCRGTLWEKIQALL